jgi:hypothetical protein
MTRTAKCSRRKDLKELPIVEVVLPCPRQARCEVTRGSFRAGYRGDKKNAALTARDIEAMHGELIAEWEYVRDYFLI